MSLIIIHGFDKVDSSWSGGIPATLIINTMQSGHDFYEIRIYK